MSSDNKHNLLYFESSSVKVLYKSMQNWQNENNKRLLSVSIVKDGYLFCCIALSNPTEVVITDKSGAYHAEVDRFGLHVNNFG